MIGREEQPCAVQSKGGMVCGMTRGEDGSKAPTLAGDQIALRQGNVRLEVRIGAAVERRAGRRVAGRAMRSSTRASRY